MGRILLALGAPFLLAGCLLSPGKFTSELQLMKDGTFAFAYEGEIQMLALSKLAEMGAKSEDEFKAECWDEEFEDRECTPEEVAEQRAEWDANAGERATERERKAEQLKALLGGIDPSDPEAANEFARRLERQRGWTSVTYLGDGLFTVEYSITGRLDHDFVFPTVERMPSANAFVSVNLRDAGQVRVDAPGFANRADTNSLAGVAPLAALAAMSSEAKDDGMPPVAMPEGTFSIVTDGRILANNTDEGPAGHARGQMLSWTVTPRSEQAPTALIAFE